MEIRHGWFFGYVAALIGSGWTGTKNALGADLEGARPEPSLQLRTNSFVSGSGSSFWTGGHIFGSNLHGLAAGLSQCSTTRQGRLFQASATGPSGQATAANECIELAAWANRSRCP